MLLHGIAHLGQRDTFVSDGETFVSDGERGTHVCSHLCHILCACFKCVVQIFQLFSNLSNVWSCVRVASDMCVVVVGLSNSLCILQLASHDLSCSILLPHMRQVVGEDKPQER